MIWSVVSEQFIFDGMEKVQYNWVEAQVKGVKMVVEPLESPGYARVVRLLSPNPNDYLNPEHAPGSVVCLFNK